MTLAQLKGTLKKLRFSWTGTSTDALIRLQSSHEHLSHFGLHQKKVSRWLSSVCMCVSYSVQFTVLHPVIMARSLFSVPVEIILTLIFPSFCSLPDPFISRVASDAKVYKRCCHTQHNESTGKMSLSASHTQAMAAPICIDFNLHWRPSLMCLAAAVCISLLSVVLKTAVMVSGLSPFGFSFTVGSKKWYTLLEDIKRDVKWYTASSLFTHCCKTVKIQMLL